MGVNSRWKRVQLAVSIIGLTWFCTYATAQSLDQDVVQSLHKKVFVYWPAQDGITNPEAIARVHINGRYLASLAMGERYEYCPSKDTLSLMVRIVDGRRLHNLQKTIITQPSSTARQQQDLYVRFVKQVNGWDVIQVNETQAKNELSSTRLQKHIAPRLSAIYPCEIYGVHAARF